MAANKILVIDDSLTVRQQVANVLGKNGYEILDAADGREALTALVAHADLKLIFCDVNMPRMGGLEFLAQRPSSSIPVVMLTTEGDPVMMQQASALGAKGWIVKPFKAEVLVATAARFTRAT